MFRKRDPQASLFGSEVFLPDAKRTRLQQSWAHSFRLNALPLIDEEPFRSLYHQDNGRPNTPVPVVFGVLILKEIYNLTDMEALEQLEFNLLWQHALDLLPEQAHLCQKTLHNFRAALIAHDLARVAFADITDKILAALGIRTGRQRIDSTHVLSNFALLTRLGLFCETLRVFLAAVRGQARELFEEIPERLRRRYLRDDSTDAHYRDAKSEEGRRRLNVCARDLYRLVERFRGTRVAELEAFSLIERLLAEQCEIVEEAQAPKPDEDDAEAGGSPVVLKEAKKVSSDSLQTPHDPDATYSGHKGKGYEVQLAETCHEDNAVEIITHVEVTPSCRSDACAALPSLKALEGRGVKPEQALCDATYSSTENVLAAEKLGIELIGPISGPERLRAASRDTPSTIEAREPEAKKTLPLTDFVVPADESLPAKCPRGFESVGRARLGNWKNAVKFTFNASNCEGCPLVDQCPTKQRGEQASIVIDMREHSLERRRAAEADGSFKAQYAARAGIEATNSELKRKHGLGKLRVRGAERVSLAAHLKALGCNVKRMLKVLANLVGGEPDGALVAA